MKIKDYIFLAIKNLSRRKKAMFLSSTLIIISMLIFIVVLSFSTGLLKAMDRAILKNISYRTIVVMKNQNNIDDIEEKIKKMEHVVKCVSQDYFETAAPLSRIDDIEIKDGTISLFGADSETSPNIVAGRKLFDNEQNACIIPSTFYPYDVSTYDESKIYNAEELLGHEITIEYNSYIYDGPNMNVKEKFEKNFVVVGIYDQDEIMAEVNDCYISYNEIKEIVDTRLDGNNYSNMENRPVMAIVDDAQNVNVVLDKIKSMGYRAIIRSSANTQLVGIVNIVCVLISSVLIFIAILNITISSIKSMTERKYEIGMLKAIGYKNSTMQGILFTENLIISLFSYVFTLLLSNLTIYMVQTKYIQDNFQLMQMKLGINIYFCIIPLGIILIIPAISSVLCGRKLFKRTPVSLNKER